MVAHAGNVTAKLHGGKIALEGNKEDSMQTMQTRNKCTRDGISRREEGVEREGGFLARRRPGSLPRGPLKFQTKTHLEIRILSMFSAISRWFVTPKCKRG